MTQQTRVRFTINNVGLITDVNARGFEPEIAHKGDEGTLIGPHPSIEGWMLVRVEVDGRELIAPVHDSQFEEVTG